MGIVFTTTQEIPMDYSHLSTTEGFTLYQYRTIDGRRMDQIDWPSDISY